MADSRPWRETRSGLSIQVRLTPRSSRHRIDGMVPVQNGLAVAAWVRAVPEKGAANAALERLVADWLAVPASWVSVEAGGKSRVKTVLVRGDPAALAVKAGERLNGGKLEA